MAVQPIKMSYLHVPDNTPMMAKTVGQLLDDAAIRFGASEALCIAPTNETFSFQQLKQESEELASGLLELGLVPGDRVGIWGPNSRQWYVTFFACAKAGLVSVSINPSFQAQELLHNLTAVGVKCLIFDQFFKTQNMYTILTQILPEVAETEQWTTVKVPSLNFVISMEKETPGKGIYTYNQIKEKGRTKGFQNLFKISKNIQFDQIYNIQFTSGSTGEPKGVMLSHHNVVHNCFLIGRRLGLTSEDKICLPVQIFHAYGLLSGVLVSLHFGSCLVFPSPVYSAEIAVSVAASKKCTILVGTPTMHMDMLGHTGKYKLCLRSALTAAAICPEQLICDMKTKYGVTHVISLFGMTECAGLHVSLPTDTETLRSTTVGYPLEFQEIKIVDNLNRIVPLGVPGEMCVRGPNVMLGYWGQNEVTDPAIWFHTGDAFIMRETGHMEIVGRLKEMINRGGENIFPREIEIFLESHPFILQAHVFGIPDQRLGEQVATWILVADGHKNTMTVNHVKDFCKGKISQHKIPHYIKFTKEFPKTTTGKIWKLGMRETSIEEMRV